MMMTELPELTFQEVYHYVAAKGGVLPRCARSRSSPEESRSADPGARAQSQRRGNCQPAVVTTTAGTHALAASVASASRDRAAASATPLDKICSSTHKTSGPRPAA